MKLLPALLGLLALCVLEILRVYFIMPFPGSQKMDVVQLAYWLDQNIFWIRITGVVLLFYPIAKTIQQETTWKKITILITIAAYCTIFYLFNC